MTITFDHRRHERWGCPMKYSVIKETCRTCREITLLTNANYTEKPIGNGWKIRVSHGLTASSNALLYYLIDPKGFSHGGYTSVARFVSYAQGALED